MTEFDQQVRLVVFKSESLGLSFAARIENLCENLGEEEDNEDNDDVGSSAGTALVTQRVDCVLWDATLWENHDDFNLEGQYYCKSRISLSLSLLLCRCLSFSLSLSLALSCVFLNPSIADRSSSPVATQIWKMKKVSNDENRPGALALSYLPTIQPHDNNNALTSGFSSDVHPLVLSLHALHRLRLARTDPDLRESVVNGPAALDGSPGSFFRFPLHHRRRCLVIDKSTRGQLSRKQISRRQTEVSHHITTATSTTPSLLTTLALAGHQLRLTRHARHKVILRLHADAGRRQGRGR